MDDLCDSVTVFDSGDQSEQAGEVNHRSWHSEEVCSQEHSEFVCHTGVFPGNQISLLCSSVRS